MLNFDATQFDITHVGRISDSLTEELAEISEVTSEEKALTHGPYKTGIEWLHDAGQPYRTRKESEQSIRLAKGKFMDALGNESASLYRKAMIEFPIAVCAYLIGDQIGAYDWLIRAKASTIDALNELDQREHRFKPLRGLLTASLVVVHFGTMGARLGAGMLDIVRGKDPNEVKGFAYNANRLVDSASNIIISPSRTIYTKRDVLSNRLPFISHVIATKFVESKD